MACSCDDNCGVHGNCPVNSDGTPSAGDNRAECPSNQTSWTAISTSTKIDNSHIQELRNALDAEYLRRHYVHDNHDYSAKGYDSNANNITTDNGTYNQDPLNAGDIIDNVDATELYNQIKAMKAMTWASNVKFPLTNVEIATPQINDLRARVNDCENDCLCNCDYCTCDCDYCTCDGLCGCDGDYGCPCNCNNAGGLCWCQCVGGGVPNTCCCNGGACQY